GVHTLVYTYTDSLGCGGSDSVSMIVSGCLGVDELENTVSLQAYPNPFNQFTTLQIDGKLIENGTYVLTDVTGKIISTQNFSGNTLVLHKNNLAPGIYLIQLTEN